MNYQNRLIGQQIWSTDDIKPKLVQQWMKIVFYENMSKYQWEYKNIVPFIRTLPIDEWNIKLHSLDNFTPNYRQEWNNLAKKSLMPNLNRAMSSVSTECFCIMCVSVCGFNFIACLSISWVVRNWHIIQNNLLFSMCTSI